MSKLINLETLFTDGKITRREFLAAASALGLTAAVSPALLSTTAHASTPKRGGRVRAACQTSSPSETLDPAMAVSIPNFSKVMQFYNTLVWTSPEGEAIPELAESWEARPDARTWYFKLRKDVTFHSGKELVANDVVFTIKRIIADGSKSSAKAIFSDVAEIKAEDKHIVKVVLNFPNADLPMLFTSFQAGIVQEGTETFDTANGTGPFTVKEFKPGMYSIGQRNPNYFKEGKPYFDEVELFAITDSVARVNALLSGEVHLVNEVDPKLIKKIVDTPGVNPMYTNAGPYINFVMMCDRPPFNNPDLRMAFKYLLDRERVLRSVYKGHGMLGNDNPISPAHRYYCNDLPIRSMDLDKAKYYYKKSGAEGATFDLHVSEAPGSGSTDMALMLQQQATKAGIKVKINQVPSDGYWTHTWMKKSFHMAGWNMKPTVDIMLTLAYKSDAPWNESRWKSEKFDKLLIQGRGELDQQKRQEIYCECQRLIRDTGGTILPAFVDYIDGISDKVKGVIPNASAVWGGHKFVETAWLES
jgi:peptide/nickel transport system substrate-binding protein